MRYYFLILFLLMAITGFSQDCNYTLRGRVLDDHTGAPLDGATLVLLPGKQAVLSDLDGNYRLEGLCEGDYAIQLSHPACRTRIIDFEITSDQTLDLFLEHHVEELERVTVTGSAYTTKSESMLENRIELETIESFSAGSIGDVLNTLSGVNSLNTGNTVVKPMINGLHSSRVTIMNNGVRMQDQEWGAEHAPNIDLNSAGSITVLKGASALQFTGDAIGGVVISEAPRMAVKDSLFGKTILTAATNGRGGSLTSGLTKTWESGWYATVQGTVKRFGDFEAPDYVLSNTGVFERDFSIRTGYKSFDFGAEGYYSYFRNDIGILRASHLGGAADQVAAINSDRPLIIRDFTYDIDVPRQEVTHQLAQLSGFKRIEGVGKLSFSYNFQLNERFEFDVRRGDDADRAAVDLELTTHHVAVDLESEIGDQIGVKTGMAGNYQSNFANPDTGVRRLIPDYDQYRWSIYGISDIAISDALQLEAGLRFDYTYMDVLKFYRKSFWEARGYDELFPDLVVEDFGDQLLTNPELEFNNFSATAGLNYRFSNSWIVYANYSLAMRAPNASELFSEGLHHSASRIELGDLRFGSEIGNKIALTLQKKSGKWAFTLNPYINLISDFIVIEPTGVQQTIRGNFQVWEYRQTSASLTGIDFDLSTDLSDRLRFEHQFSYVRGYDRSRELPLINIPAASTANTLRYSLPDLNRLQLYVRSDYVFRQNEFPDNNFEVFIPETGTNELVDVSTPPDAYHLLEVGGSATFELFDGRSALTTGLTVSNLFNTSYRNYLNRLRYYADELGRNIQLNLKVNY